MLIAVYFAVVVGHCLHTDVSVALHHHFDINMLRWSAKSTCVKLLKQRSNSLFHF